MKGRKPRWRVLKGRAGRPQGQLFAPLVRDLRVAPQRGARLGIAQEAGGGGPAAQAMADIIAAL